MENKNKIMKIYGILFHIAFFITFLYMAYPQLVSTVTIVNQGYLILYVLLAIIFVIGIALNDNKKSYIKNYILTIQKAKWILIFTICYVIWDLINYTYAINSSYFNDKYIFMIKMIAISVFAYLYIFDKSSVERYKERILLIFLNLGIVAIILALTSTVFYYIGKLTLRDYKIAPTADYNNYALTILIGAICLYTVIIISKKNLMIKITLLGLVALICIPAIYLSASRRAIYTTVIIIAMALVILLIYCVFYYAKIKKNITMQNVIMTILVLAICVVGVRFQINTFYNFNHEEQIQGLSVNERLEEDLQGISESSNVNSKDKDENIKATDASGGVRGPIWNYSISQIKDFNEVEFFIGGGGSYSNDIFKMTDAEGIENVLNAFNSADFERISTLDPHNFILNDMLEGGIIKIIILFSLIWSILIVLLKNIKSNPSISIPLLLISVVIVLALMVSAHFGIMWGRWSILIIMLAMAIKGINKWENTQV